MWKYHSLAERVDGGDVTVGRVLFDHRHTPCVIGVSRNDCAVCVRNGNYIALQVLIEIVCGLVVFDTTNCSVEVVQVLVGIFRATAGIRYKLLEDIRSVKDIVVNFRCRPLLNPDANSLYHTFFILSSKNSALISECGEKVTLA